MNRFLHRSLGVALMCGGTLMAYGMPANPAWRTLTQPDGSTLSLSHRGDERCSFYVTESGLIVRQSADGWYRVVANDGSLTQYTPSDFTMKASDAADYDPQQAFESIQRMAQSTPYARMPLNGAATYSPARVIAGGKYDNADGHDLREVPTTGSPHVLVILVNYADTKFSFCDDPHTEMSNMMMQHGYSNFGATGSACDFYTDQSRGLYTPQFDVYGPVQLPQNRAYYGGNNSDGSEPRAYEMVVDACRILDPDVDFSIYDTDGDGKVDNVYVFYAGYGENDGGTRDCVWPHAWQIQYATTPPEHDGVVINRYACSNELRYTGQSGELDPTGIGTFCHEFGHVLGQPDMYATTYTNSFTPGSYSAMDHGSYNNDGRTPPNFSAYERYAMEWLEPVELTDAASISMLPIGDGGNVYKINVDKNKPTEYWLFENRQQRGWDEFIPGHGMLVWHIDYVSSVWDSNVVNNTPAHQYVDIVEADNTQSEGSRMGDTFPGSGNVTSFTAATSPAFRTWTNVDSQLPLTEISEAASGVVSFNVKGGDDNGPMYVAAPAPELKDCTASTMKISWPAVDGASGYNVSVRSQMVDPLWGDIMEEYVPGYEFADLGNVTSIELDDLQESTTYVVQVYARSKSNVSQVGEGRYNTFASTLSESVPALQVTPGEKTADMNWVEVPGATGYALTVATRAETTPEVVETVSFDNKKWPAEWLFDASFDERYDYSGNAAPALSFVLQGSSLISGIYSEDIAEIDFWARVNRQNARFSLDFYAVAENGSLVKFHSLTSLPGTKDGADVRITDVPDGTRQWMCIYTFSTADLRLNVDDFVIKTRGTVTDTPVAGYDAKSVSDGHHTVTGLEPSTNYVAWLTASNSAETSKKSQVMRFTTLKPGSVDILPAGEGTVPVFVVTGGVLRTDAPTPYDVYTVDGRAVALAHTGALTLPARGIYVVRCGAHARTIRY